MTFFTPRIRQISVALFLIAGFIGLASDAHALALRPALVDLELQRGAEKTFLLTLRNDEEQARTFYIYAQGFVARGENGEPEFLPLSSENALIKWSAFTPSVLQLQPNETRDVRVAVEVPEEALPGAYQMAVFVSTQPPPSGDEDRVMVGARTGALVFANVAGAVKADLRLITAQVRSDGWFSHLPVWFDVRVRNAGNLHVIPDGRITIRNGFGQIVARLPLNERGARVLAGSTRHLAIRWIKEEAGNDTTFFQATTEELRNFALGPYHATIHLESNSRSGEERVVSFVVFPWRLATLLLIVIVLLVCLLSWQRRRIMRRVVGA